MRKVQEYSETIKCDCCGAELAKVYRSRYGKPCGVLEHLDDKGDWIQ